jgi:hypothetical protein
MHLHLPQLLTPHRFQVVLLQSEQQRLRNFDEPVGADENLVGSEALVGCPVGVESLQSRAAAVEDTPEVALLEGEGLGPLGPVSDLLGCVFEGIFED